MVFCTTLTAQTKVANFTEDFTLDPTSSNWKYYWNKPDNWQAGSNPGDLSTGAIGNVSSYTPLVSAGTMLSADGDLIPQNSSPDTFIRLDGSGGHPGDPGTDTSLDRYVISAYTVSTPGNYYILNSSLNFPNPKGNGVKVYVHVNSKDADLNKTLVGSGALSFDVSLGNLDVGDVIYVAVGANGKTAYDGFQWDFDISTIDDTPETNDYYVSDYGAVGDGSTNDMDAIRNAVAAFASDPFPSNLHFENKTYRCLGSGILFDLQGAKNKNIFGNNAELIVQPSILGLVVENSENITAKDLTFDSDPLSWTQGTITAINSGTKKFTLTVDDGYPIPTNNYGDAGRAHPWGMVWEPTGYTIKNELVYVTSSTAVSGNSVEFTMDDRTLNAFNDMKVNDRFTIDTFGVGGTFNRVTKSSNITFENIIMYAARSLQFVININEGAIHMDGIQVRRKPDTNRLLSGYRDGFHCKDNKVGPIIENCYIEGICDDAINLHSKYLFVTVAASATQFTMDNANNLEIGDILQFANMNTGEVLGQAAVASKSGNVITTASAVNGVVAGAPKTRTTTFVINLSKSNSDFIIRNNHFAGQRRYAMLIRSPNGLIENNIGVKTQGGIILTNEIGSFFEGPVPSDIIIKNNSFTDVRRWPIWLDSKSYAAVETRSLKNIVLENNTFGPSRNGEPAAVFHDVENLELLGNNFVNDVAYGAIDIDNSAVTFLCDNTFNGLYLTNLTSDIVLGNNSSESDIVFDCADSSISKDNFAIEMFSETCRDKANGKIVITAIDTSKNYVATINTMEHNFNSVLTVENLPAGVYDICISVVGETSSQCYKVTIKEGETITGESSISNKKAAIEISKGTAPFQVLVNGKTILQTYSKSFTVDVIHGDLLEVKTAIECEGVFSKEIDLFESIFAYPNPSNGKVEIAMPSIRKEVVIDLFSIHSQLISSNIYTIQNGKVQLNIEGKPTGIYFIRINLEKPVILKIIKQ